MKKLIMVLALVAGLTSCSGGEISTDSTVPEQDRVEVIYFHGKQRCAKCVAVEQKTQGLLNREFADEMKNGTVVFRIVDISSPEGEKIADNYEVTWSSLYVNRWKGGQEIRNNMTEAAFGPASKTPGGFMKALSDKIRQSLK